MFMKGLLLLFFFLFFFVKVCDSGDDFMVGEFFIMEFGQELMNNLVDLIVKWLEVVEDFCCLKNINCVWEGQVKISFLVNGDFLSFILCKGKLK